MIVLLTGGSGCGKSAYAEQLLLTLPAPRYYLAAMMPYGGEGERRILRHRAMREGKGFISVERYTDVGGLKLPARGSLLLECLCNLTANEMFEPDGAGEKAEEVIFSDILRLYDGLDSLILVTNDVGSGSADYGEGTLRYMRVLGNLNRRLAKAANSVAELTAGIPTWLKGGPL